MISELPLYINLVFVVNTLLTVVLLYKAAHQSNIVLLVLIAWLSIQTALGLTGFYAVTDTLPPRFMLLGMPPVLLIVVLFFSDKGRAFIDQLNINYLAHLHIVRVPVELVLYWLFLYGAVPQLMTFEGANFDIIAGLTAPIIAYAAFNQKHISHGAVIIWNVLGLALLGNIIMLALLSASVPFQQFAFEQPNIAVIHFPFVWLPSCIVPIVMFAHLATLRRLIKNKI